MNISPQLQSLIWLQVWQVTLLVVVVGFVAVTTLRRRPHVAFLLWALLFVKCLMPPLWSSPTGVFSWLQASPYSLSGTLDTALAAAPGHYVWTSKRQPSKQPLVKSSDSTKPPQAVTSASHSAGAEGWRRLSTMSVGSIAFTLWIAGTSLLSILALIRFSRMARTLGASGYQASPELEAALQGLATKLDVRKRVRLIVSPNNDGPLVFGYRRPLIVLPEVMVQAKSAAQLEPILAHELIHIRRGDTVFGAVQFLAQVIWWFHPLIWWAGRQVNRTCERCCDAEVVASLDFRRRDYANSLLDVLEFKSELRPGFATPGVRAVDITKNRVKYIMNESVHFQARPAKIYWILAIVLALIVLPGGALLIGGRQDESAAHKNDLLAELRSKARVAIDKEDWGTAVDALRKVVEKVPSDARSWFLMGYALHANGQLDEAIKVHRKATEFPPTRVVALYNLSCAFALKGDRETALKHLEESLDAGFTSIIPISEDTDFVSLIDASKFKELAARAMPLASRETYRQFDFWVGDWDVMMPSGEQIGTNIITNDEKGFLLTEKWTNSSGGTGTSISFYDPGEQKWKQTWVDERGTVVRYTGEFENGEMRMVGKRTLANGKEMLCRKCYTPRSDGTVRQVNECSDDGGATWSICFDGIYHQQVPMETRARINV
ncbi:MAG: M56 family metallopeptidase [Pirellulaceae bacterium]|jgi:beta-lactamase regulating signal transducer with metallopeptidase domain|nr:M56 family metallopeptidase [Pirellulaceae bacterium]